MHSILKPALLTLIAFLLTGCVDSKITTSSFRDEPIAIEEAETAIRESGIVKKYGKKNIRLDSKEIVLTASSITEPKANHSLDMDWM